MNRNILKPIPLTAGRKPASIQEHSSYSCALWDDSEKVRLEARALAPVPISRAAQSYIDERNSKRDRISDIPFHRLWQSSDAGQLAFSGLRVVDHQNLLLVSNGTDITVLPISPQQRRQLAPIARGTLLTISSQLLIQTPVQGLEL